MFESFFRQSLIHIRICLQVIRRYFKGALSKNREAEVDEPKPKKVKQLYSIRDVIKQHYRALIDDEIPYKPTEKEYLGSYQRAVTTVLKNMSDKDLEDAEEIVERWNKEGAPSDVQLK